MAVMRGTLHSVNAFRPWLGECKNAVNFQLADPYATPRRGLCLHDLLVSQFVSFPTYPTFIDIFA
jgi:hypothetical protein